MSITIIVRIIHELWKEHVDIYRINLYYRRWQSLVLYDKVLWAFICRQRYFFPRAKHERECRKCREKKKTRSIDLISFFLRQSWSIGYPEINRERMERRERERERENEGGNEKAVGSAARLVQLTIKESPRTLIHGDQTSWKRRRWRSRRNARGAADKSTNQSRRWSPPSYSFLSEAPSRLHPTLTVKPPRSFRSFPVSRESTEVFRTIVLKNHSVD